jgi:Fungal Zn(2)-Cys(6) binuclear cluster domain/Fungal specific transcription factor domain
MLHPTPVACTACRRSHLRCDAKSPICSRCMAANLQCNYTPSRRGVRKAIPSPGAPPSISSSTHWVRSPSESPRMNTIYAEQSQWPTTTAPIFSLPQWSENANSTSNRRLRRPLDMGMAHAYTSISDTESLLLPPIQQHTPPPVDTHDDHLVNLFYTYFQPAHPILLPRCLYTSRNYPTYLRHVVHFIGSQYSSSISSDSLAAVADAGLRHYGPKILLLVQARLLYAIALHSRNDLDGFQTNLTHAITDALELGMNEEDFPAAYGRQNIFEEESIRRTWWELYVVEGYMGAFWHRPALSTTSVAMTVGLPCDEKLYNEGQPSPEPPSLDQFSKRLFADDDTKYSSFCYRIEAVRSLTRVLTWTGAKDIHRGRVQAVDNALAGWIHHFPPDKTEVIAAGGEVDEILFQAQMIIQCASIILHFPRSRNHG